jgi:hypothetical protein
MDTYSNSIGPSELLRRRTLGAPWAWSLTAITFLALAFGAPVRSQEPPHPAGSVAEAARNVREHQSNSAKHPKIFTNDDLRGQYPVPSTSASPAESSSASVGEVPKPPAAECDNPEADRVKADLALRFGSQTPRGKDNTKRLTVHL